MENFCLLPVKVLPNATRTEIAGWLGEALKVRVQAPALEGRANEALCEFLAKKLQLPERAITVTVGKKSRQKLVRIAGFTLEEATAKLGVNRG